MPHPERTRRTDRSGRNLSAATSINSGSWPLAPCPAGDPLFDGDDLETRTRDLLLEVGQRDDRHGGVPLRDKKGDNKTLVIKVGCLPSPFQEPAGRQGRKKVPGVRVGTSLPERSRWCRPLLLESSRGGADEAER